MSHQSNRSRLLLLSGASLLTLLATHPAQAQVLSNMKGAVGGAASGGGGGNGAFGVAGPRLAPPGMTPQQAATKAQQSTNDFNAATNAVINQLAHQAQVRVMAQSSPGIPGQPPVANGLGAGSLQQAGLAGSSLWQNAKDASQQVNSDGATTVTIDQTAQKAILTWDSFNVGAQTTVHFDQTGGAQADGTNNWIALNRIVDPSLAPSQILGQIKAEGTIYLINRNGIMFGGTSQVDTHSLVASSLSFLGENIDGLTPGTPAYDAAVAASNATFLNTGFAGPEATGAGGASNLVLGIGQISVPSASDYRAPGDITIYSGANIVTHTNGPQTNGGFVLIAGTNVTNAGVISTPDGQAILAAGVGLSFTPNPVVGSSVLEASLTGRVSGQSLPDLTPVSTLTNTGVVQATRGAINLLGTNVNQNGVVEVTTGVSYPGSITITAGDEAVIGLTPLYNRAGLLSFGSGSVTANLPEEDGETATSSPTTTFIPGSVSLTAGSVWFQGSSLLEAPGANVTVTALASGFNLPSLASGVDAVQGRILVDDGATIDVAGLTDVKLPISDTLITIPIVTTNEIEDNPNQQDLLGLQNIIIDGSLAGVTADGRSWLGTPVLDANGYVQQVPRKIDQLLLNGGSITLAGKEVLTAAGSALDLDGGYVNYQGGSIATTRLVDSTGHMVPIGGANPNDVYVGIAGVTSLDHTRWGVTDSWSNSLITSAGSYQPGYIAGGNAGTLTVYGESATVLDGAMSAQVFVGPKQVAAGAAPSGAAAGGSYRPVGGTFDFGDDGSLIYESQLGATTGVTGDIIVQDVAPQLASYDPHFGIDTQFDSVALGALDSSDPNNVLIWKTIPADLISNGGFANVKINDGRAQSLMVADGAILAVQAGGSITNSAASTVNSFSVTILGSLIAPSGTISLAAGQAQSFQPGQQTGNGFVAGDLTVGSNAVISTAGQWINDNDLITAPGANAFINGGSINLSTAFGGSLDLEAGSLLNVSSGGVLLQNGLLSSNGIPEGKGGNVALIASNWAGSDAAPLVPTPPTEVTTNPLVMDGTIEGFGFAGGGKLTLQALGFQIGGELSQTPSWAGYLPADYFASQGFGSYQLNAMYDVTVAPGATVDLTQRNFIPNLAALSQAATGADLNRGDLTALGTLDAYRRQATNLTMTAGGDLNWSAPTYYVDVNNAITIGAGASIDADAGATVTLGSLGQVTVLGSIVAHGGSITLTNDTQFAQAAGMPAIAFSDPSYTLWLGSDALLDVSGTVLTDPLAKPVLINGVTQIPTVGEILDGGTVTLAGGTGNVVAQGGSVIDVSGSAGTLDEPNLGANGRLIYASQQVWSDAGSISLEAANGLFFDGTLKAQAGAPQGAGGTLTILPEIADGGSTRTFSGFAPAVAATALILRQSGDVVPTGLVPGQAMSNPNPGTLIFSADRLAGSGISTLILGGPTSNATSGTVPIAFAGEVDLTLGNAVIVMAPRILALPQGATSIPALAVGTSSVNDAAVTITAPYVEIAGATAQQGAPAVSTTAALGDGVLNVNASFIDLENGVSLQNIGQANFTSNGDIRLSSTNTNSNASNLAPGMLFTSGDVTLKAADIYPVSGTNFIINAVGPNPTTVTILGNGASSVPLSAGGSLLIDATDIVQGGTLRAPFGNIVLGVNDPTDTAALTAFNDLPLTATQSVKIADSSLTSVSAGNEVLPFGTTVDGATWSYNPTGNSKVATLTAPPAKSISLNGADVSLDKGGTIDLSGGGDLQAEEWVPGSGGTRDVLSQYNVDYSKSSTGTLTPLYADARNVYAIVPGYAAPAAAYDPVFAEQNSTGSGLATKLRVGQAGAGDSVGKAVYLSGVAGLPAGIYTLLPAKYATLPGAYRVVVNAAGGTVAPGQSQSLTDGSQFVSGYFVDALDGSHNATSSQFEVQSAAVWGKYSEYKLTSANTFFAGQAASAGTATPLLPQDAGQLVLSATNALSLGSTLKTAAATDGIGAQVDIASQDIQITGQGQPALAGYIQLSANDLDALGAGSLLIGGTRTQTDNGVSIQVAANSVVVSNDAADPLTGSEIILVAKDNPGGADPNAANGLQVNSGSVITASGALAASAAQPITIGDAAHSGSGDGALLRVSNAGQVGITRVNVGSSPHGLLTVAADATINGGAALTLDSSGGLSFDPAANFSGTDIAVDAPLITFTNAAGNGGIGGFVVGPNGLAQFASAKQVDLRSFSDIDFDGDLNLNFGEAVELSAGNFVGNGAVSITAPTVTFANDLSAPVGTAGAGQGSLTISATQIDLGSSLDGKGNVLGTGNKALRGFSAVTMTASGGIVGQGTGSFDMGAAAVTLAAPVYLADTGSDTSLTTTGALVLNSVTGMALTLTPVGGAISFTGGALAVNGATIAAPGGDVSLEATSGDLTLASGSTVSSAGVAKTFFDTTQYAPGGVISLTADLGNVKVAAGSTLDFSGADGGGAAGSLALSAPTQTVALDGTIKGTAAKGSQGGSFSLDTGGAVDLDNLATELASSGVNDAIQVQTGAGNLLLSAGNTLTAVAVSLTANGGAGGQDANDGNVQILGAIDASGTKGGVIDLYGKSGVDLEGSLIATGSSATERGGTVQIGTVGNPTTVLGAVQVDQTYGYELVSAANSGAITLGANALIDVSGGTAGGLTGGTVSFRAPLLDTGDVNLTIGSGAQIKGSRATTLEAFAVWSTDDPLAQVNSASKHFDGVVDPAGQYDSNGNLVAGSWADQSGNALPNPTPDQLASYLANDIFTPTTANADHQGFYGYVNGDSTQAAGTLMGFVENFPVAPTTAARFANIQNFAVTPGIELDNPDLNINGGDILVLTNWNLGAGSSPTELAYRFNGAAPIITFRAENDIKVKASLSDGFFQIANPVNPGASITVPSRDQFGSYSQVDPLWTAPSGSYGANYGYGLNFWQHYGIVQAPGILTTGDPDQIKQYYTLWAAYAQYLISPVPRSSSDWAEFLFSASHFPVQAGEPAAPTPPSAAVQAADPGQYLIYLAGYEAYVDKIRATFPGAAFVSAPAAPVVEPVAVITVSALATPPVTDNAPSSVYNSTNPLPSLSASLASGASSSYRIVAGANFASVDPLALQSTSAPGADGGVILGGGFAFADSRGQTIYAPTMIRTGTGSIDIAAANDVSLFDPNASGPIIPGVIYTAGQSAAGSPVGSSEEIVPGSANSGGYDVLATNAVNPDAAGDISIRAGGNIIGVENTNVFGNPLGQQFWYQWMQTGNALNSAGQITQTSINFGAFDQGVVSVGGNIAISAGGDITNLSVSLPTTWYLTNANKTVNTVGGGDLTVVADHDILGGDYFVAKGTGAITAGGVIGSSGLTTTTNDPISTILAVQDGILNISARQGVDIGAVVDPSYVHGIPIAGGFGAQADSQGYSATSAVNILTTTGGIAFNTLADLFNIGASSQTGGSGDFSAVLPATVNLTALTGGIDLVRGGVLFPSPSGEISLIAQDSINIYGKRAGQILASQPAFFGMIDADPSAMPSPLNPLSNISNLMSGFYDGQLDSANLIDHSPTPLHADDPQPVRIYSLNGSITDGLLGSSGLYDQILSIVVDKPAQIYAGQDILNLAFVGENLRDDDVTRIVAGRDIWDSPNLNPTSQNPATPSLLLGGGGTFDVEAGRNIGPLSPSFGSSVGQQLIPHATGITAIGNTDNPYLPHISADVNVLFGVAPGIINAAFAAAYVDPSVAAPDVQQALVAFMEQYDGGHIVDTGLLKDKQTVTLTLDQAWTEFQALPTTVQQIFNQKALFITLTDVGADYNDPSSVFFHQYARGYQALNTLFPASLGYTANSLDGGTQGALTPAHTGNLDLRGTTIQTQQGGTGWTDPSNPAGSFGDVQKLANGVSLTEGGNVMILGPGGQALIGSSSAPPATGRAAATQGILTLETGDISIFTDTSVLLAQSRIMTEQGGAITAWSSNGDVNAGAGAKTTVDIPAPIYVCNADFYCARDARGEVSGAGISNVPTIPGISPSNVELIAPRGTVDFGAAGVRVSGNLIVAAQFVANAANAVVQGQTIGVPTNTVDVSANLSASTTAAAAAQDAVQAMQQSRRNDRPSVFVVTIDGFGPDAGDCDPSTSGSCSAR